MQRTDKDAVQAQAAFIRDYGTKLCNCAPLGNLHEPHCLGARHFEVAETLESLKSTEPLTIGEDGLVDELEKKLSECKAERTSFSCGWNLIEAVVAALRNQSPDRGEG